MSLVPGHEDDPDQQPDDQLRFTATPRAGVEAPVPAPVPEGRPTVGVREPRVPAPKVLEAEASVPVPVPERPLPDAVGIPIPGIPEPVPPAMRPVFDTMRNAIQQVPRQWAPNANEVWRIQKKLGQRTEGRTNTIVAIAEDVAADAFATHVPGLVSVPFVLLPLLKWLFRRRSLQMRPGVLGKAGPADPVSRYEAIRGSQGAGRYPPTYAPRLAGGFGLQVNTAQWMRELQGQPVRRRLTGGEEP